MKTITATIASLASKIRIRINDPIVDARGSQVCRKQWSRGVTLSAIYAGRKWFVAEFYSIWDRGDGGCVGTYYVAYNMTSEIDRSDILEICDRLNVELPTAISAQEI